VIPFGGKKEIEMLRTFSHLALGLAALTLVVSGCRETKEAVPAATAAGKDSEHGHKPGTHGGNIVEIGRDNYHAEAVFEKNGVVRLYLLGQDEARVQEVDLQTLTAYAKLQGGTEAVSFALEPFPTKEDSPGKTSQFTGTLPRALWGKPVEVIVPSIRIASERFRFGFKNVAEEAHATMPPKASSEKARELYLTPGGRYTAADIKANGGLTAAQRYGDKMSAHDSNPKPSERICPITDTRANPEFTWVVDGKKYEFCCPPCIDEFVRKAKESPTSIKEPGEYVKH
jgi:hypothetical protein